MGRPFDRADQDRVVRAALQAFSSIDQPGAIVRRAARWNDDRWCGANTRMPRDTTPQYQNEDDRRPAEARARQQ
ncbi:hypothetical protein [Vineibacter terrae]|uniref:hypothetical protein n=1 Tax=Vineibacter terrae TaxID=2586908 RepID=UPI002E351E1C|nr:hypothetical protein [Vineibacter terrae]HEX2886356.1 hypothetical protein [Vineibacter terrae]